MSILKSHSCMKLWNNVFLAWFMNFKKENKGSVYMWAKDQELAFGGLFLRSGIFISLLRVLLLLNYLSFSLSLCTLKERSSTCRTEKEAEDPVYSRDSTLSLWTLHFFPEGGEPVSVFDFIGPPGEDSNKKLLQLRT